MEHIRTLTIEHLRGFGVGQTIELAIPDGTPGSGLTILVGANSSGKSTVIEALKALALDSPTSYSTGKRNAYDGRIVRIYAIFVDGRKNSLETVTPGASETQWSPRELDSGELDIGVVQSLRGFEPYFAPSTLPIDRRAFIATLPETTLAIGLSRCAQNSRAVSATLMATPASVQSSTSSSQV